MRAISTSAQSAIASSGLGVVTLVLMAFKTPEDVDIPIALNTSNWDLVWEGVTYKGAYGLGSIDTITDKPGEVQGIKLEMISPDSSSISLALDDADIVQGTPLTIRTALIDLDTYQILDAPLEWAGKLDTMSISDNGEQSVISVTAESKAVDLLRGEVFYYSDADQRTINPNDGSFSYVLDQIDKAIVWPAKAFYYQ